MSDFEMEGEPEHRRRKPWAERSGRDKALLIAGIIIGAPCVFILWGGVTMWLWNALMPVIFKLPEIGFWQAIGLLILSQFFFKGHIGRAGRGQWRKHQIWKHMREDEAETAKA
jgi:hypothetical protein